MREWTRSSGTWAVVIRWYFALLLLSMVVKYFSTQWGDVLDIPITHPGVIGKADHAMRWARRVFLVYRADVVESWLILLLLLLLGHVVLRLRVPVLACASLAVAVVIAFACWLALSQTGVPLTWGTVLIGVQWSREHPEVIPTIAPLRAIALMFAVAMLYGAIPVVTTRRAGPLAGVTRRATEYLTLAAPALLLLVLVTPGRLLPSFTSTLSPSEGYWSSTFVALADIDRESPVNLVAPTRSALMHAYWQVAYPLGRPTDAAVIAAVPTATRPKHVVIVALETAPRAYYPLARDSTLPTFAAMARHSIVSEHHYTSRTYTLLALYSILTGTYPRPGAPIGEFGAFHNDGLAATLAPRGYETTYIDSYKVDWGYHYRAELRQQGFATILDTAGFRPPVGATAFEVAVAREHWSFRQALAKIADARAHRSNALVVIATTLGHFPWRAPPSASGVPSVDKIHRIAQELDRAMGEFLRGLDSLGVRDSTIFIVTGDHGLRYKAEFDSFGTAQPADVDFNVPFLLYAPSLISQRIELPYATSHVDIAPTVYALLGIPTDSLILHGENMLDGRLAHRATFLMNTGLNPNDGFRLGPHRFVSNLITHEVRTIPPLRPDERVGSRWTDTTVPALLAAANHVFNLTAAFFLAPTRTAVTQH